MPQPLIYLLCDARDEEAVQPLDDYLFEQEKMEVRRPLFQGDEAEIRKDHQENLRLCDAVLLYHGHAGEAWLRAKLRDLRKAPGYGRKRAFAATAVYVAGPEGRRKERFRSHEVDAVIKHYDAFSPDVLAPFLDRINAQRGGPGR